MQFRVPKYLERESTIAFGLTFKNLAVLGGAGLLLFLLFYVVPRIVFIFLFLIIGGGLFVFNFVKIRGQSLFETMSHASGFVFSKRVFIWQKKPGIHPIKVIKKKKQEDKKRAPLRVAPKSQLGDIRSKIDLGR